MIITCMDRMVSYDQIYCAYGIGVESSTNANLSMRRISICWVLKPFQGISKNLFSDHVIDEDN